MRKITVSAFVVAIMTASHAVAGDVPVQRTIDRWCADRWPNDYEMQLYCFDQQITALQWLVEQPGVRKPGHFNSNIAGRCMLRWANDDGRDHSYDWEMVKYCFEKQRDAHAELERRR